MSDAGAGTDAPAASRPHAVLVTGTEAEAEAVARLLAAGAVAVDITTDPDAAIGHLRTVDADVVIVGTDTPGGAVDLIARLRRDGGSSSAAPVIVTGGRTPASERIRTFEAGADAILTKPFHIHELRSSIQELTRLSLEERDDRRAQALEEERRTAESSHAG